MMETIKKGALVGAVESVWLLGGFDTLRLLAGDTPLATLRTVTGLLGLVILFVGIWYGIHHVKRSNQQSVSYLQCVKTGVVIALVVGGMVSLFSFLFVTFVNPQLSADMIQEAETSMRQAGLSPERIAERMAATRAEYSTARLVIAPLIVQPVMGTIFALVISVFLRSRK